MTKSRSIVHLLGLLLDRPFNRGIELEIYDLVVSGIISQQEGDLLLKEISNIPYKDYNLDYESTIKWIKQQISKRQSKRKLLWNT